MKVPRTTARATPVRRGRKHLILVTRVWDWSNGSPGSFWGRITFTEDPGWASTFSELPVDPGIRLLPTVAQVGKTMKFTPT